MVEKVPFALCYDHYTRPDMVNRTRLKCYNRYTAQTGLFTTFKFCIHQTGTKMSHIFPGTVRLMTSVSSVIPKMRSQDYGRLEKVGNQLVSFVPQSFSDT